VTDAIPRSVSNSTLDWIISIVGVVISFPFRRRITSIAPSRTRNAFAQRSSAGSGRRPSHAAARATPATSTAAAPK
jgi:hypothetical protein